MTRSLRNVITGIAAVAGAIATGVWSRHYRARERRSVLAEHMLPLDCEARHAAKVEAIAAQLRAPHDNKPVSLHKHAPPHQVPKFGDLRRHDAKIDVSALTQIITIDPDARTCVAESGAMFEDVVAATLRYGLIPLVVPELKTITIGGAVTGCSIESMSFRYGGFHDSCLAYEVITATGEVLQCTPDNANHLLFQMMQCSFGTLGILSKLTFKLVPAKPFVAMTYEVHASVESYLAAIDHYRTVDSIDFIDGIIHGPNDFVLSLGRFVDHAPYHHAYDWMRVYYQSTHERSSDYLRVEDYLFRYDRGVTSVHPKSFLGRLVFGKLLDSGVLLGLADKLPFLLERERPTVTLDVFLPRSRVAEFLAWYERELGHFPLWCVPYKRVRDYEWLADSFYADLRDDLFIDVAIYGFKPPDDRNYHKMIEDKLRELGGVKTLIAHNYYTAAEFWQTWNRPNYEQVKQRTDPEHRFRDLYSKTCRAAMGLET